jgi:hypothetical protein
MCLPGHKGMASAANLISRNVILFATSTKTAAAAVNKQYILQSSGISNFHLRHLETCNIFKNYCLVIFALTCIVQGVNNVLICPIYTSFYILGHQAGQSHPNVCICWNRKSANYVPPSEKSSKKVNLAGNHANYAMQPCLLSFAQPYTNGNYCQFKL